MRTSAGNLLSPWPRRREPELMDSPAIDEAAHADALRGLARLNAASRTAQALFGPIRRLALARRLRPVRILDVACGAGDVARRLHRLSARAGLPAEVAGCDLSQTAVSQASGQKGDVHFFTLDALHDPLPSGFDVLTCSLFLHHLSEDQAIDLLRRMAAAAGHMLIVSDLHRSRFNFAVTFGATRLLSRSPVVRYDGLVSVRAAYTAREARELARAAGLDHAIVRRHWACRYLLEWERPHGQD